MTEPHKQTCFCPLCIPKFVDTCYAVILPNLKPSEPVKYDEYFAQRRAMRTT